MSKKILIFISTMIIVMFVSVIFIEFKESSDFTEEVLFSEEFNPEMETYDYIYFDYKDEVALHERELVGVNECVYIDNEKKLYFRYPEEFENWYFGEELNSGETKYRNTFSFVSGIKQEDFEGFVYSCQIFPLENENIAIVIGYASKVKVVVINPNEKKMVDLYEFSTIPSKMGMQKEVRFVNDVKTVFYDPVTAEILCYDNASGELLEKSDVPGESFISGKLGILDIEEHDQYWYTANKKGIYRTKSDEIKWECIIPASKAKSVSLSNWCQDMLVVSESEIYLFITKDYNGDGSKATAELVKFNLK